MTTFREMPLFEVPVYLESQQEHRTAAKARLGLAAKTALAEFGRFGAVPTAADIQLREDLAYKDFGGPWQYNQIVGWYRLYAERDAIRVEWWRITGKRYQRDLARKRFGLADVAVFRVRVFGPRNSREIQAELLASLRSHVRRSRKRKLWLDSSCLEGLGQWIDWSGAVGTVSDWETRQI